MADQSALFDGAREQTPVNQILEEYVTTWTYRRVLHHFDKGP